MGRQDRGGTTVNADEDEAKPGDLVIIRRSSGGEETGHKGGVWKIAYADFMTAMMAFFLVMWLINSTDKKTLTQVAIYFNPIRLTDKVPVSRGLHQSETGSQTNNDTAGSASKQQVQAKAGRKPDRAKEFSEEVLLKDPQRVLAQLAGQAEGERRPEAARGDGEARSVTGEAYRDPFEPAFRREIEVGKTPSASKADAGPVGFQRDAASPPQKDGPPSDAARTDVGRPAREAAAQEATKAAAERTAAAQLEAQIRQAVAQALQGTHPNIDVTVSDEGLLVSMTDGYDFGMFAIASAVPRPAMVLVMEKLGRVLASRSEPLIVRGHTDGRPYKSDSFDNWRLSGARAHIAYHMLLRGGIDERRFERVEAYADRSLRIATDPEAAQNRRIEILLRKAKP
jgi:chemotaxis protein MotB